MSYDLKFTDCMIVDGTGTAAYRGDVATRNGKIVALGEAPGAARHSINADGRVVAPGFVDIHTHYDAQVLWDRMMTVSPWHGVTTVVMGNCGFTVAPTQPQHRDLILRTFERVEGMDLSVLQQGIGSEWGFATYPEYLDVIERRGVGINVAGFIGHTALRLYVMGEAAVERAATDDEITEMQIVLRESLDAGALGFSTSTAISHWGFDGKPVASRLADRRERFAMACTLREAGKGLYYFNGTREPAWDEYAAIVKEIGRPVCWGVLLSGQLGPGAHRKHLQRNAELNAAGAQLYPQTACRPIVFEYDFRDPVAFSTWKFFSPVREAKSDAERLALYANQRYRESFGEELAGHSGNDAFFSGGSAEGEMRRKSFMLTEVASYPPEPAIEGRKIVELATERSQSISDLVFDLILQSSLHARFRTPVVNFDEDEVEEILQDPNVIVGLGDAGAHASQLCDACYSTHLLGHWVRERKALTLERAVHMLTGRPADVYGITDRGRLAIGRPADIVMFDPETIAAGPLRRVNDFPGGAMRLVSDAVGVEAVVVNGTLLPPQGERLPESMPMPGRVLRSGRANT